ncbi:MAG: GAF domain-containing protein [Polyangiaceae bacterium]|nr:GAF domain-containing protein [Polyangiaceae bacterium]MCW5792645.1 GAF domain-containing protein [Polyangiaceae bacterium]
MLLRGRPRKPQIFFAAFAADIGLWYLAQWLYHFVRADVWAHFTALLAVLLPQFALNLFESVVPEPSRRSHLVRVGRLLLIPMLVAVLSPEQGRGLVRGAVFVYVFGLIGAGLWSLALRGQQSDSRATQRRVRFLVLIGALAMAFTLADFLWFIGAPLPPVGAVLSIVFLFVLAESMSRERLLDLYETLGRLLVATALAFALAGIFYVSVVLMGGFDTMYLSAVMASIVILVLFEPLRAQVEEYIHKLFFLERVDLDKALSAARRSLLHVLQVDEMARVVISSLERSRRATGAALYLRDPGGADYRLADSFGAPVPQGIEAAAARALLDRLRESPVVVLEDLERATTRGRDETKGAEGNRQVLASAELLGPLRRGLCAGVRSEGGAIVGVLVVVDDRVRDAFSPDEAGLFESLAVQIGVVIENSRVYLRLQEQDRLAALGQMAAGLAHEIKNPLGAIKGAAQLLSDPDGGAPDPEFVDIILEEVERLDRVVGSVLDYARPSKSKLGATDVSAVVARTAQLLRAGPSVPVELVTELASELPPVRADAEQLRQVLINLVKNAQQAGARRVVLSTRRMGDAELSQDWVEIVVHDDGPGIAPDVMDKLFLPFFTTKHKGTGLGLAISQRLVQEMGGAITATSHGAGASFNIRLPAAPREALSVPPPEREPAAQLA